MKDIYRQTLQESPIAYGYHRLLIDSKGKAYDYIFLDVNSAFEEMTGLKKEYILGKRVTEVLPKIKEDDFDWIKFYGEVVFERGKKEVTEYSKILNCYYKIIAFSQEEGYFTTLFFDITQEINLSKQYETLFKNSPDAIACFDKNHMVV